MWQGKDEDELGETGRGQINTGLLKTLSLMLCEATEGFKEEMRKIILILK